MESPKKTALRIRSEMLQQEHDLDREPAQRECYDDNDDEARHATFADYSVSGSGHLRRSTAEQLVYKAAVERDDRHEGKEVSKGEEGAVVEPREAGIRSKMTAPLHGFRREVEVEERLVGAVVDAVPSLIAVTKNDIRVKSQRDVGSKNNDPDDCYGQGGSFGVPQGVVTERMHNG